MVCSTGAEDTPKKFLAMACTTVVPDEARRDAGKVAELPRMDARWEEKLE